MPYDHNWWKNSHHRRQLDKSSGRLEAERWNRLEAEKHRANFVASMLTLITVLAACAGVLALMRLFLGPLPR